MNQRACYFNDPETRLTAGPWAGPGREGGRRRAISRGAEPEA